jgi:hypothetical protein
MSPSQDQFEFDEFALQCAANHIPKSNGASASAYIQEIILEYLSWCNSDDRNFSDEMIAARANFKRRCEAEPDECHSKIWEEVKREAYCGPPGSAKEAAE